MVQGVSATNGGTVTLNTVQVEKILKDNGNGQLVDALRDIDPRVMPCELVAVMGLSDSGKSSSISFHCSLTKTAFRGHGHA